MKKVALSLLVLAASGAYVWQQAGGVAGNEITEAAPASADGSVARAASVARRVATVSVPGPAIIFSPLAAADSAAQHWLRSPIDQPAPVALASANRAKASDQARSLEPAMPPRRRPVATASRPAVTPAAMTVGANSAWADGTYTGPSVDAYYGMVQVQAIVENGRLISVKVLHYPSDRRTSVAINRQALPMLRDEVLAAQSANVDIISGATLTSEAFIGSLRAALRKAGTA